MIQKKISYDLKGNTVPFSHFFRATGYANADYTYTNPVRRMYDMLNSYPGYPQYMRLHNVMTLHGQGDYYIVNNISDYGNPISNGSGSVDVVVKKSEDGKLKYDWTYVDEVYDIIIKHGMHPIVETVYMPSAIQKNEEYFYIPENYAIWYEVLQAFVKHWIERYGIEEVKTWYFEICNEPEQYEGFRKQPELFFALYDYFEAAIHAIDKNLQAGGPAVKQWEDAFIFFEAFLLHCSEGPNFVSGLFGTRVDFLSVHCKAGDPQMNGPSMDNMFDPLKRYASILERFPCYKDIPFFNDESDIVWDGNRGTAYKSWLNFRNTEYAPGFICKMIHTYCDKVQDAWKLNLVVVDSDNCHLPWERRTFSGNRSQLTPLAPYPCTDLIRKPMFNAFQLLGKLGTERYIQKSDDVEFGIKYGSLGTKLSNNQGYSIMLWNFEDGLVENVNTREIALSLHTMEKGSYHLLHFAIDSKTSNAYRQWEAMGMPESMTEDQVAQLRGSDGLELVDTKMVEVDGEETYSLSQVLRMHSVHLFLFVHTTLNRKQEEFPLSLEQEENSFGKKQVFLKWPYSSDPSFIGYNVYRQTDGGTPCLLHKNVSCAYCYDSSVVEGSDYSYSVSALYADGMESASRLKQTISL